VLIETECSDRPHTEVEHELLGFTHQEVGGLLLQSWGLGPHDVAAASFHHEPNDAPRDLRPTVDLVHLGDVIVSSLQIGNSGERAANPLRPEAWTRTSLRSRDVGPICAQVERQVQDLVAAILG
jgi:HD-like signal output (HDOD) protein